MTNTIQRIKVVRLPNENVVVELENEHFGSQGIKKWTYQYFRKGVQMDVSMFPRNEWERVMGSVELVEFPMDKIAIGISESLLDSD